MFRSLTLDPWLGSTLYVASAGGLVDASGELTDEATRDRLRQYLTGFSAFVQQKRG